MWLKDDIMTWICSSECFNLTLICSVTTTGAQRGHSCVWQLGEHENIRRGRKLPQCSFLSVVFGGRPRCRSWSEVAVWAGRAGRSGPARPEKTREFEMYKTSFGSLLFPESRRDETQSFIGDVVTHSAFTAVLTAFSGSVRRERRAWRKQLRRCFHLWNRSHRQKHLTWRQTKESRELRGRVSGAETRGCRVLLCDIRARCGWCFGSVELSQQPLVPSSSLWDIRAVNIRGLCENQDVLLTKIIQNKG